VLIFYGRKPEKPMLVFDLKGFRRAHGIKQTDIMKMLDCVQSYVSQIENGTRPMPENLIEMLRNQYDDVDDFMTEQDEPDIPQTPTARLMEENARLMEIVESQQRTIENLSRLTKLLK